MIRSILELLLFTTLSFAQDWPADLPFPKEMVPYKRSAYTQAIGINLDLDRVERHHITRIDRNSLEERYRVPGGLVGVQGWKSELYAFIAPDSFQGIGTIQVLNSRGYFQPNQGYIRRFGDGTVFADVLTASGKIFEVRMREKTDSKWDNFVAYRDYAARPRGYKPVKTRQCQTCHAESGSGSYGLGLAPGGDGVFSYPIQIEDGSVAWPVR